MRYAGLGASLLSLVVPAVAQAQLATLGAGLLVSKRPSVPVAEFHAVGISNYPRRCTAASCRASRRWRG